MTAVFATAGAYRAAVAELPLSARLADDPAGAIVVVPGETGWVDAALEAAAAGAVAVVVAAPAFAPAVDIRRLQTAAAVPVVVERPLLRPDSTGDAVADRSIDAGSIAPRLLVADGGAPSGLVPVVARDAVGWLRVLAGGRLSLVTTDGAFALLETVDGIAATLSIVVTSKPGGSFRVRALGEVRTHVEVEVRRTRVRTSTTRGTLSAPDRYESSARLAVRRALAAVESALPVDDVDDLVADTALVDIMLARPA